MRWVPTAPPVAASLLPVPLWGLRLATLASGSIRWEGPLVALLGPGLCRLRLRGSWLGGAGPWRPRSDFVLDHSWRNGTLATPACSTAQVLSTRGLSLL